MPQDPEKGAGIARAARAALHEALFSPRSIALIGASADPGKRTSLPQRYLRKHGFSGQILPINPNRTELFGERAYPSLREAPTTPDHAFIMLPTALVPGAVRECAEAGVAVATILSDGFAERGEAGRVVQEEMVATARGSGMRLVGPNSLGLVNTAARLALSANEVLELPEILSGSVGVLSQSGSMLGALLARGNARGLGYSKMVSVGNEADLAIGEFGDMLLDDPETDVLLLFLETIRNRAAFVAMAVKAHKVGKPIAAFTLGRSPLGQQLAASHTGALAGAGSAMKAFLRDCGIVHVDMLETLYEIPALLRGRRPLAGKSKRVSIMTTTGGGGAILADCLSLAGVEVAGPGRRVVDNLAARGIRIGNVPLVDLTLTGTNAATFGAVLEAFIDDAECDAVAAVVGSSSQFRPDRAVAPIIAAPRRAERPLAVFLTPEAQTSLRKLQEAGIAGFRTPEACADALRALLAWRAPRRSAPGAAIVSAIGKAWPPGRLDAGRTALDLLDALAITRPRRIVLGPTQPPRLTTLANIDKLHFPVALKVLSVDIAHKTEVGGVALGIETIADLEVALSDVRRSVQARAPKARIDGFEVQSMERGLAEVLIGYRLDAQVGPIITLGMGGVMSEVLEDVAIRMAPVDEAEACAMIAEVNGLKVVGGYRGLPEGDLAALARAVCAVSMLAAADVPVQDFELNPVLVRGKGQGIVAVDSLLISREAQ